MDFSLMAGDLNNLPRGSRAFGTEFSSGSMIQVEGTMEEIEQLRAERIQKSHQLLKQSTLR